MVEVSKSANTIENRTQQQVESSLYMPSMYDTDYSDSDEEGIEEIPSPFNLLRSLAWSQDDQDGEINMDVDERRIMSLSPSRLYRIDSASSILIEEDADKENGCECLWDLSIQESNSILDSFFPDRSGRGY